METQKKLSDMIEQVVQEKTFSLEAVDAIKLLRDHALLVEKQLAQTNKDNEDLRKQIEKFRENENVIRAHETKVIGREDAVAKRELNIGDAEKRVAVAEAVSNAYVHMFGAMFQNRIVRETVQNRAIPVPKEGYADRGHNGSNPETTTREEA